MRRFIRLTMPSLLLAAALAAGLGCTGGSEEAPSPTPRSTTATASPSPVGAPAARSAPAATATWAPATTTTTHELTISATGAGRVSPLPGAYSHLDGESVTVTATPDEGWSVASWGDDCNTAGTATTCTLTMDADKTASVTFELPTQTLTVTVTGPGGEVTPSGTTEQGADTAVTLTASWNDATHYFTGWTGDCVATTSTCVLTMDAAKAVTATFTELPANRCATPTAADCIRAVYRGAPGDYAQVADIPADRLLTPTSDGRYHVERGQQYTVVTAAQLPEGWTHFYLQRDPGPTFGVPSPVSFAQLIQPIGTTYTFTVASETGVPTHYLSGYPEGYTYEAPARFRYDLKAAKPFVRPRPDDKPLIGDTVVTAVFQTPQFGYDSFDDTAAAATSGSYGFLMPDDDAETEGATEPVTTYEQMRTEASALVVNVMNGGAQEGFYDGIEDGELLEWREAEDCWTRFMVTGPPSGTGDVRSVPVKPYAYSGYGCSGAVAPDTEVTFDWDPSDIPIVAIGAPVHYGFGRWLLVPYKDDWDGPLPLSYEDVEVPPNPPQGGRHPLYSEPDVPDDWTQTFIGWDYDDYDFSGYGYAEQYHDAGGEQALLIYVLQSDIWPWYINFWGASGYVEARVIEGYPAVVRYVPEHRLDWISRGTRTWVQIYDVDRDLLVWVEGQHRSLWGTNIEGTIAIALSILKSGE